MGKLITSHTVVVNGSSETGYEVYDTRRMSLEQFCQIYASSSIANMRLSSAEYVVLMYAFERSVIYPGLEVGGDEGPELGCRVGIDKEFKMEICSRVRYHLNSVEHAIRGLVSKGLLIRTGFRGKYYLNPEYFFKGSLNDRVRVINIRCELSGGIGKKG